MRRFIAYIAMCSALLLGVGAAVSPTIVNANTDLAYSEGKTLTFRLSSKDIDKNRTDNYDPANVLTEADGMDPVNGIADIMRSRLDAWGASEYTVSTVGYNTVTVSLRTSNNNDQTYAYLEQYLAFSGGDIEVDAAYKDATDPFPSYSHDDKWTTMFDNQVAHIEYIEQSGVSSFPVVIVPITGGQDAYTSFTNLLKFCQDNTTTSSDSEQSSTTCSLVVWANRHSSDYYYSGLTDTNVLGRVIANESTSNDNAIWYASSDTDKKYPSLQIIPSSNAISGGKYDASKANEAYESAKFLSSMINAEKLNYQVNFLYEEATPATVENLVNFGSWTVTAAMSRTLIATIVAFAVIAVILAFFDRTLALGIVSTAAASTYLTFLLFVAFGTQFNVAALLGLLVVAMTSVFGGLYYTAKLKDELYKGRTLKKAHSEAAKKAIWPTIDASLIVIILGIFIYIFAGDLARKLGAMMVVGGFVTAVMNLLFFRIEAWLLCNDNGLQSSFPKMLNVQKDKIPDMLKEEKQSYFGPYEKNDFTKSKRVVGILAGLVSIAGIVTMITFGVLKGTVYNDSTSQAEQTVLMIEARSDKSDANTNPIKSITSIYDETDNGCLLKNVFLDGVDFSSKYSAIEVSETPLTVYDSESTVSHYWYYFKVTFSDHYDLDKQDYAFTITDGSDHSKTVTRGSFEDAFSYAVVDYYGATDENSVTTVMNVVPSVGVPYLSNVSLGVGVGIAVCCLYMMIRYRISRGFTASFLALVAGYGSLAFFVFTRIAVTPVVSLGSAAVVAFVFLASIFILQKEKEIYRDSREKEKATLEFRSLCLTQANNRAAGELILFALVMAYLAIDFFGFGPSAFASIYLNLIIGVAYGAVLTLALLTPLSLLIAKLLSKIHFRLPHHHKKNPNGLQLKKSNSAEPEEAVFIGIND
jgi:preprotein translocase subunit SecF